MCDRLDIKIPTNSSVKGTKPRDSTLTDTGTLPEESANTQSAENAMTQVRDEMLHRSVAHEPTLTRVCKADIMLNTYIALWHLERAESGRKRRGEIVLTTHD